MMSEEQTNLVRLEGQVSSLAETVSKQEANLERFQAEVKDAFKELSAITTNQIEGVHERISEQASASRPQFTAIIASAGLILSIVTVVGNMAIGPLDREIKDQEHSIQVAVDNVRANEVAIASSSANIDALIKEIQDARAESAERHLVQEKELDELRLWMRRMDDRARGPL